MSLSRFQICAISHEGAMTLNFQARLHEGARLSDELSTFLREHPEPRLQGVEVLEMPMVDNGNAVTLMNDLADACGFEGEHSEGGEPLFDDDLWEVARRIDQRAEDALVPVGWECEGVWNNGGGDDNLWTQGFMASDQDPEASHFVQRVMGTMEEMGLMDNAHGGIPERLETLPTLHQFPLLAEKQLHRMGVTDGPLVVLLQRWSLRGQMATLPAKAPSRAPRV